MPTGVGDAIGYPRFFVGFQPGLIKSIGVEMAPTKRIGENVLASKPCCVFVQDGSSPIRHIHTAADAGFSAILKPTAGYLLAGGNHLIYKIITVNYFYTSVI